MARITKIEATKSFVKERKIRVAAYTRVSTKSEEQLLSLEIQKEHYESYINANTSWEYAGLYYDEGISGTKIEKREGLLALLKDCEDGKIDRVITKSISRFSRNTTDCLEMVRKLTSLKVFLFFEKENIDTEHMSSELMLSILSSIAESESKSISQNSKWSIKNRFKAGTFIISYPPYGYENKDGKMNIVPKEADIVKEIFTMTINGMGTHLIARELNNRSIPSKKGAKWHGTTVRGILQNEKYTGDAIFQKTYTDDNYNRHINYGEENMYLYKNHHEPIVSHEMFDKAAEVIKQRGREKSIEKGTGKYQSKYAFSGKIYCGECGATFKRRQHYKPSGDYVAWCCNGHIKDKNACSMMYIRDEDIKTAFLRMTFGNLVMIFVACIFLYLAIRKGFEPLLLVPIAFGRMISKLQTAHDQVLKPFVMGLKGTNNKQRLKQVLTLEEQIEKNAEQATVLTNLMSSGYIEPEVFHLENNQLTLEADRLARNKQLIVKSINGDLNHLDEAQKLLRFASKKEVITEFNDALFLEYVDTIKVNNRNEITFALKCGLNLTERLVKI